MPHQVQMYRERIRTVGVSLLGGNSGVEGPYELGIDSISAVNVEDVTDAAALGGYIQPPPDDFSNAIVCIRESPYRRYPVGAAPGFIVGSKSDACRLQSYVYSTILLYYLLLISLA